ncbi:BlaI/MecI/CopY family transcriptional regulator [Colwellia sp. D2M02]|uniref:BlaI/MecI/CopY family transcriptional regulator n=1 Tax=Colwellia asteriadis TaxID=517723 RepID=A0ABN1L2U3_9GAMM|nr:BlaI/MecI/CopY family transcriptional regulator [Colwellia sp. D2M02]MBU2893695.1 BlaI/MecI/CopY family transcriptional regulator [Colwellia sp. D2M02]
MTEISNAEFEVLDALWQQAPASANEIIARLNQHKEWHEKTVKTLLNRLVKKQAISFEKQQRHYLYSPLVERDAYTLKESQSFIERMFSGKITPLVANFAKQNDLNKEDVAALKALISDWEKNND